MKREIEECFRLNSRRKLYKKRIKDKELVEIGYYRCVSRNDTFIPYWSLHIPSKVPDTETCFIEEVFNKESYYPGWLGENEKGELEKIVISPSLEEMYVNCNEVVGFKNIALDWSWYYQDFVNTDKNYY